MAIKTIITEPNPILKQISEDVDKVGKEEQQLMDDMLDTMYKADGIGLAAVQVGILKRIIVMDISRDENKKNPMYFVNPVIKNKSLEKSVYNEGCLSVVDQFIDVERPTKCEVEYLDYNGEKKILNADGLLATCIQHEIDHLKGILFIDYLSKLKRDIILKKLSKQKIEQKRLVI